MQTPDETVPGDLIRPRCQGKIKRKPCHWPRTTKCGNLWLCDECAEIYFVRRMVRRVKAKLLRQRRRVT
jgi:hypothetical protein